MSQGKGKSLSLRGAVPLSHLFLRERVKPGDRVVDATCGNGNDTLLLARLVGEPGRVWAFDLQEEALAATRRLLAGAGVEERVELVAAGHEKLADIVREPVAAVVFNLGYLPGGDKEFITRPATTVAAVAAALELLLPGGLLLVVIYTGHPGAAEEEEAVLSRVSVLDPRAYNVWTSRQANRPPTAPYLVVAEKAG
ncbi:MAG TPA: class I SAM-dependent methyltransferase [Geobacteraceae bacterium]